VTTELLADHHVAGAAVLLAERVAAWRRAEPLLPSGWEHVQDAALAITALRAGPDASGVVAWREDQLVGYLVGTSRQDWSVPNAWIAAEGCVVTDPSVVAPLYAAAAQRWVEEGRFAHHVLVPAADAPLREAWHRLDFGIQHVHAATALPTVKVTSNDVVVRRGRLSDASAMAPLDVQFAQHLNAAPVWSGIAVPSLEEAREEWRETLTQDDVATFVAEVDGEPIGAAVGCGIDKSSAHTGLAGIPDAGMLAWITIEELHRGRGHSRALADAVLDWLHQTGFGTVVTDWRAANVESSLAWRRFGFRDTFYRLHRTVR